MISGNMETKLWAGAALGGIVLLALAAFVLVPAVLIALINWSERRAIARVLREGVRCQVLVKSYRRVSMTQHRVLFEMHLPEGRVGREYMLSGLSDADLANWTVLQTPLVARALADATTIALEAVPPSTPSRSFLPMVFGACFAVVLASGAMGAVMYSDDEAALDPDLRALCTSLRGQEIDVANVRVSPKAPSDVKQRAWLDLDGEAHEAQRYRAAKTTEPKTNCLRSGLIELCTIMNKDNGYKLGPISSRVRAAFLAHGR
jgi:hypothetical protein